MVHVTGITYYFNVHRAVLHVNHKSSDETVLLRRLVGTLISRLCIKYNNNNVFLTGDAPSVCDAPVHPCVCSTW